MELIKSLILNFFCINWAKLWVPKDILKYFKDVVAYKKMGGGINSYALNLVDYRKSSGKSSGHYFWQDFIVSKSIYKSGYKRVLDIGSRVDGFITSVSVHACVDIVDVRENVELEKLGVKVLVGEGSALLAEVVQNAEYDCITCLHTIEHIGLGRYGDAINPDGDKQFLELIYRLVQEGKVKAAFISVPIAMKAYTLFNSHRVYAFDDLAALANNFRVEIEEIAYVSDEGGLCTPSSIDRINSKYALQIIKVKNV